jgi:hypothetical protein
MPEGGEKNRIIIQQTALVGCCWLCCWVWKSLELPHWTLKVVGDRILAGRGGGRCSVLLPMPAKELKWVKENILNHKIMFCYKKLLKFVAKKRIFDQQLRFVRSSQFL